ncbi:uncharacterized protein OCT59_003019 [Rhizophagus irregularis]|uniref:uncharacterized protein n=1 Tax=Rhizophagus irregularis TaxID=588596 RepID=UPI003322830F|nr:hypothetical protein OCT59_003019 [Rhizophagus irregularis]
MTHNYIRLLRVAYNYNRKFKRKNNKNSTQLFSYNEKSDIYIYSIGVLLWEISSRKSPFSTEEYDIDLAIEISQGLREEPILNTSENYIRLYKGCWDGEPDNRPTIKQAFNYPTNVITSSNHVINTLSRNLESDVVARREVRNQINTNFRQNRNLANEIIGNSVFVRGHEEDIEQQLQIGIPIWIEMYFPEVTRDEIPSQYQGMTRR